MKSLGAVPYIYALEEGFYDEVGIKVEIIIFDNANDRDAALIGKHIDGINTDFVMLANNLENGINLTITAITEEKFMIVTNQDYLPETIGETNNAKVGTFENGVLDYLVTKLANDNQITYTKMGIPSLPARKAALDAKEIDMAILPDPFASLSQGKEMWNNLDHDLFVTCLAFRDEYLNVNKEVLKKFFKATDDAILELDNKEYSQYKSYIIKHRILTEDTVDLVSIQPFNKLELPSEAVFNEVIGWMESEELISKSYSLNELTFDWSK